MKALHEIVKGGRVAAVGATRKVEFRSPIVRVRTLGPCIAGLYDRTHLINQRTHEIGGLFRVRLPDHSRRLAANV